MPLPWSTRFTKAVLQPLQTTAFVLELKGYKVLVLKLPRNIAGGIVGDSILSEGLVSKIKSKVNHAPQPEQWLAVTSIENPLLEDYDNLRELIVQGITEASGVAVNRSDLSIAASIRL